MSPPRRRSSRLAAAATNFKRKATPELSSVAEGENTTINEPPTPQASKSAEHESASNAPHTPQAAGIKPDRAEMHPSKCHTTMASQPSSALRLGFTDKPLSTLPSNIPGAAQGTPTRMKVNGVPATDFTFRFTRDAADVQLSENAQRLMNELREHATKIKADLRAQREAEGEMGERKIAQPKSKVGRYSAAHMAEFKKMDSIEGHASAWRANRTTPVKPGDKSSQASTPIATKPSLKRSHSKANLDATPQSQPGSNLKRTSSRAKLDDLEESTFKDYSVSGKPRTTPMEVPQSTFVKRVKKFQDDDASSGRPVSRDGSNIPRPKSSGPGSAKLAHSQSNSSLSRLMSPTKSSMAHSATASKSTISLVKSPSKPDLGSPAKTATPTTLASPSSKTAMSLGRRIISPGRFQKVKSILRGQKTAGEPARTALPKPSIQYSQTPAPTRTDKELPPLPLTTPRRKLVKHVAFTPDTKRAAESQNSPSPLKFGAAGKSTVKSPEAVEYPSLDGILTESTKVPTSTDDVVYPDLSNLQSLTETQEENKKALPHNVPGTFSFRSDHTIDFGAASSTGFGASPGQASVRQVRASFAPKINMPGSFPAPPSPSTHPNKENTAPPESQFIPGAPHGLPNKKRHRPTWDEEDVEQEAADRAAKKQKSQHSPEKKAAGTPRLTATTPISSVKKMQSGRTPGRTPSSASPTKKRGGLSISRLNMLARPKQRT